MANAPLEVAGNDVCLSREFRRKMAITFSNSLKLLFIAANSKYSFLSQITPTFLITQRGKNDTTKSQIYLRNSRNASIIFPIHFYNPIRSKRESWMETPEEGLERYFLSVEGLVGFRRGDRNDGNEGFEVSAASAAQDANNNNARDKRAWKRNGRTS